MNKEHEDRARADRDDIAVLVRLAGKRRAVPPVRAERVREAARTEWRQVVRRRSRARRLWTAAGLTAAAVLILAAALGLFPRGTSAPVDDGPIVVESVIGQVWTREASSARRSLGPGDALRAGSELLTADGGRAAIRLGSGHSVRIDTSTSLRLVDAASLALDRGAIYVDSGPAGAGEVKVVTPFGVVREIGTQFEVRLEERLLRVRLREGAVVVRRGSRSHEVVEGHELTWSSDGVLSRGELSPHGPEWTWIAGVTPMLDLEGRTARTFLNWVARERGLRLAFADERVARAAGETVLSGTTERLTLDEALDAVLPTCRMTYRIDGALLIIAAVPDEESASS